MCSSPRSPVGVSNCQVWLLPHCRPPSRVMSQAKALMMRSMCAMSARVFLAALVRSAVGAAGLLQAAKRAAADEIENLLVKSLETARRQQALSWQLRTTCDLARLWQGQGRGDEALTLLQSIYDRFTEGFGTADLIHAKALLENLVASSGGRNGEGSSKRGRRPLAAGQRRGHDHVVFNLQPLNQSGTTIYARASKK